MAATFDSNNPTGIHFYYQEGMFGEVEIMTIEEPLKEKDTMNDKTEYERITGETSDGYHTFNELYEHRITLYIALCKQLEGKRYYNAEGNRQEGVWKSKVHSDGTVWEGWFLLGIFSEPGKQITYHLPLDRWKECEFVTTLDIAPDFDGHTPQDVLQRIKAL